MLKKIILPTLIVLMGSFAVTAQTIDATASKVTFTISNMGLNTVEGTFTGMKGSINFSPDEVANAAFNVCVDANTVDTGISKRDEHLKRDDYFDVATYPTICFASSKVTKTASGYTTTGTLTMHGVSKTVEIPFTFVDQVFTGTLIVERKDYRIGPSGGFMVGHEVEMEIICKVN